MSENDSLTEAMARQTAQAKLLREARDEFAQLAARMHARDLIALGLSKIRAAELSDGQPFNSADLAEILGVALPTVRNWMAPANNEVHREMPKTARYLLDYRLRDARAAAKNGA